MKAELIRQLRGDEGEKPCVYVDSLGFYTIGVGRLVDKRKPGAGLKPEEISFLLQNEHPSGPSAFPTRCAVASGNLRDLLLLRLIRTRRN